MTLGDRWDEDDGSGLVPVPDEEETDAGQDDREE